MTFDKWFNSQSRLLQIILMIIPVVGWILEILIRLSVALRTKEPIHWVVFLIFVLVGWGWILNLVDLIYLLLNGHLILAK